MMSSLQPYLKGEGQAPEKWAFEMAQYTFSDEAQDDLNDLLTTNPSDGEVAKLQHIISALTAGSSDEQYQLLTLNFTNTLSKAFLNYCVDNIGSLDLDAMKDLINLTLHEIWKSTQSPPEGLPDAPEVVSALKSSFKLMGVESDSDIATNLAKYTSDLAKHFVDNAETMPRLSTKISSWSDQLKSDFQQLSTEDFNKVSSLNTFVMTSVATTVAAYATTHESDANWVLEDLSEKAPYINIGVFVINKALRYIPDIRTYWEREMPEWYYFAEEARCQSIINASEELRRPQMGFNDAHVDWQQHLQNNMQRYAEEVKAARNEAEAQRIWLRRRVNFILGPEVRVACNLVLSSLNLATAIYALSKYPNDPWSIKAWEVAQIAVDSLGLLTNGYIVVARGLGRFGIELGVAECIPVLGEIFAIAGAAVAVVLSIVQSSRLSPEQIWVRDVGSKMLKMVKAPTSDWLAEHPLQIQSDVH
jgi:hypothetical protein